MILLLILFL